MLTFKGLNDTRFYFNSDLSGDVTIISKFDNVQISIPATDLKLFMDIYRKNSSKWRIRVMNADGDTTDFNIKIPRDIPTPEDLLDYISHGKIISMERM